MFDTYTARRVTERTMVNITEQRAATDESVRLLKEMQQKAEAALLATTYVETNGLKATVQCFIHHFDNTRKAVAQINLNGHRIKVEHVKPLPESKGGERGLQFVTELRDKIATAIANEVMQDFRFDF